MLGHGAQFDQKMEPAIAALLSHRNVEDAARAVGISVNTLRRWMQVPEFQASCREARQKILSQAMGQLQNAAGAAAKTVLKIMIDPTVPAGIRLRAAEIVLEHAVSAGEIDQTEDRLARLERVAGFGKSAGRSTEPASFGGTPTVSSGPTRPQIAAARNADAEINEDVAG
jgi:hypothetical protein